MVFRGRRYRLSRLSLPVQSPSQPNQRTFEQRLNAPLFNGV